MLPRKRYFIQLKDQKDPRPVYGEACVEDGEYLVIKDQQGLTIGKFRLDQLQGWWVAQE